MRSLILLALFALIAVSATIITTDVSPKQRDARRLFSGVAERLRATGHAMKRREPLARMWDAVPEFMGLCNPAHPVSWEDSTFVYSTQTRIEGSDVYVDFHLKRKALGVTEYLFNTLDGMHVHTFILEGDHTIHFASMTTDEIEDVKLAGVRAYRFRGPITTIESLAELLWFWIAVAETKIYTPFTNEESLEFMKEYMNYTMEKREDVLTLTADDVHAGDVIGIARLDGLDPCVLWVTGSRVAHMGVVWEVDGVKSVCESQAAMYWPREGIQCNPWDQWVEWARKAEYNVVVLPMSPVYRARLNITAGIEFFRSVEGVPYGFQTFLAAGFDTIYDNLPAPLNPMIVELFGAGTNAIAKADGSLILYQSLTKRVDLPENASWGQVLIAMERKYGTMMDGFIVPELDDWTYNGKPARVCSSFVIDMLRHAGVFGSLEFNAAELSPHDVTEIALWDRGFSAPSSCAKADPQSAAAGYCQLMGKFRIDLGPTFNTWQPHTHMGEHCASNHYAPQC